MNTSERRRLICEKLARRIREVAPAGIGHWDPAWEMVAGPSDRFLDALAAFLEEDTPETRERIHAAADALVKAWRRAGEAWKAAEDPQEAVGHTRASRKTEEEIR